MMNWKPPTDEAIADWLRVVGAGADVDLEGLVAERIQSTHEPGRIEAFAKLARHMGDGVTRERYDLMRRMPYTKAPTLYAWAAPMPLSCIGAGDGPDAWRSTDGAGVRA